MNPQGIKKMLHFYWRKCTEDATVIITMAKYECYALMELAKKGVTTGKKTRLTVIPPELDHYFSKLISGFTEAASALPDSGLLPEYDHPYPEGTDAAYDKELWDDIKIILKRVQENLITLLDKTSRTIGKLHTQCSDIAMADRNDARKNISAALEIIEGALASTKVDTEDEMLPSPPRKRPRRSPVVVADPHPGSKVESASGSDNHKMVKKEPCGC